MGSRVPGAALVQRISWPPSDPKLQPQTSSAAADSDLSFLASSELFKINPIKKQQQHMQQHDQSSSPSSSVIRPSCLNSPPGVQPPVGMQSVCSCGSVVRVGLLGVAYGPGIGDTRFSPVEDFYTRLSKNFDNIQCHDPYVSRWVELDLIV